MPAPESKESLLAEGVDDSNVTRRLEVQCLYQPKFAVYVHRGVRSLASNSHFHPPTLLECLGSLRRAPHE